MTSAAEEDYAPAGTHTVRAARACTRGINLLGRTRHLDAVDLTPLLLQRARCRDRRTQVARDTRPWAPPIKTMGRRRKVSCPGGRGPAPRFPVMIDLNSPVTRRSIRDASYFSVQVGIARPSKGEHGRRPAD
jgi:hypothetical protein